ncbi:hypothetical protein CVT25_003736 [Psilocybe cyanescens]|uniref:Uncharacterized protein n=1 Tax=Psilocybe cyanescens TaxID=93625 RepID=A0A409XKQ0_PSICY|nr:hypothetical protein CVT25_003736 [Psilocybe cyanescens]
MSLQTVKTSLIQQAPLADQSLCQNIMTVTQDVKIIKDSIMKKDPPTLMKLANVIVKGAKVTNCGHVEEITYNQLGSLTSVPVAPAAALENTLEIMAGVSIVGDNATVEDYRNYKKAVYNLEALGLPQLQLGNFTSPYEIIKQAENIKAFCNAAVASTKKTITQAPNVNVKAAVCAVKAK